MGFVDQNMNLSSAHTKFQNCLKRSARYMMKGHCAIAFSPETNFFLILISSWLGFTLKLKGSYLLEVFIHLHNNSEFSLISFTY